MTITTTQLCFLGVLICETALKPTMPWMHHNTGFPEVTTCPQSILPSSKSGGSSRTSAPPRDGRTATGASFSHPGAAAGAPLVDLLYFSPVTSGGTESKIYLRSQATCFGVWAGQTTLCAPCHIYRLSRIQFFIDRHHQ